MSDQRPGRDPSEGAAPGGPGLHDAGRDLSSLFGDESDHGRAATALGPQRVGRPRPAGQPAEGVSDRLGALESQLQEAVLRIESVDQHLATTYQALQELGKPSSLFGDVDGPETLLDRVEKVVADRIDRFSERLSTLEAQLNHGPIPSRLEALEDRVSSTLSLAELSREAVVRLEKLVGALLGPEATEALLAPSRAPVPPPPSEPKVMEAPPTPQSDDDWADSDPVAELDALLGAPYDAVGKGPPPGPDDAFWPSEPEASEDRPR